MRSLLMSKLQMKVENYRLKILLSGAEKNDAIYFEIDQSNKKRAQIWVEYFFCFVNNNNFKNNKYLIH